MLDESLAREIRRAAPKRQDDRQAYFAFRDKVLAAKKDMSTTEVREHFDELLTAHGRVVTAIVVAATLWARRKRLEGWQLKWAEEVIDCWPHSPGLLDDAAINDGLHPSRICEYAGKFIRMNSVG